MSQTELDTFEVSIIVSDDLERAREMGREANSVAQTGDLRRAKQLIATAQRAFPDVRAAHPYAAALSYMALHSDGDVDFSYRIVLSAFEEQAGLTDSLLFNELLGMLIVCAHLRGDAAWWDAAIRIAGSAGVSLDPVNQFAIDAHRRVEPADSIARQRQRHLVEESMQTNAAWKSTTLLVATSSMNWQSDDARFLDRVMGQASPDKNGLGMYGIQVALSRRKPGMWKPISDRALSLLEMVHGHGLRYFEARLHGVLAIAFAYMGRPDESQLYSRLASEWALPRGLRLILEDTWHARCVVALARSEFEEAYAFLTQLTVDPARWSTSDHGAAELLDLAEACERLERVSEARPLIELASAHGIDSQSARQAMALTAARAVTEPDAQRADSLFRSALNLGGDVTSPFDSARIRVCYARFLFIVQHDSVAARAQLRRAMPDFEMLGARLWQDRVQRELREYQRPHAEYRSDGESVLSSQERLVAQLAASGLSNKQIASQLFISARTVSYHLYNAFPKLGISSRAGLRDALTHHRDQTEER